jgi:hypothetical protein
MVDHSAWNKDIPLSIFSYKQSFMTLLALHVGDVAVSPCGVLA